MSKLAGRRIVVTRAPHQAAEQVALLEAHGAVPLLYPCIDIAPPSNSQAFDTALRALVADQFDWLIVTSANTVLVLKQRLDALDLTLPQEQTFHVAAVGPATAEALNTYLDMRVSALPETYLSEAIADVLPNLKDTRVLLPQSSLADSTLPDMLAVQGCFVTLVPAYETVVGSGGVDLPALLREGKIDAITLTSGSTVTNLLARLDAEGGDPALLNNVTIAAIGPKTARVAQVRGLRVDVMSDEHTLEGIIDGLEHYYAAKDGVSADVDQS